MTGEPTKWQKFKRVRFSDSEYSAFVAAQSDRAKLAWLSMSGDILTADEHDQLNALLSQFFSRKMKKVGVLR